MFTDLISIEQLAGLLGSSHVVVLDARFSLADTGRGRRDFLQAHIPGAAYVHLDHDLSGQVLPGKTGRHPLPDVAVAAALFGVLGIGDGVQVVVYDDAGGALAAARAWWMLRWLGHTMVAVLDGGWQAWLAAGMDRASGDGLPAPGRFTPRLRSELVVDTAGIEKVRLNPGWRVGDARAYERYQGKNETIDRIAGRIPGAISTPYQDNLTPEGFFRSPAALCAAYTQKLQTTPPEKTVFYCGSGVTSIHNILAMQVAGLGEARLYPGSWSEWIVDPARPIATG